MVLAFSVIAWALPAGASAEVNCALALATDAGIVSVLSVEAATSFSAAFLVSAGFDAHRADPLAGLELEEPDYTWVTSRLLEANTGAAAAGAAGLAAAIATVCVAGFCCRARSTSLS